jgi:CRISPR/Cas system Type II protein with McrA/HNH and RuvC-like nuclease domain
MESKKNRIYNEQKGKCFFCEKEFPIGVLTLDHLLPRSLSGDDSLNNLVLSCPECNMRRANNMPFREIELVYFLQNLLDKHPDFRNITQEALISSEARYRADILAEQKITGKWTKVLIEIKTIPTFTKKRLDEIINQLTTYKSYIK